MTVPRWLEIARADAGTKEAPGAANNPKILGWSQALKGWWRTFFAADSIPWCAVAMNAWLQQAGIEGTGTARARDFAAWGVALASPVLGCLMVFSRPEGAHVGLYLGETATHYRVWGGNQRDQVCAVLIAKGRCDALRWPYGVAVPNTGRVYVTDDGTPLSKDEA